MQFMVTNGGPHPADKWAEITAEAILNLIVVDPDSVSKEAVAARKIKRDLQPVLFDIFNEHHTVVQSQEKRDLKAVKSHKHACERCAVPPHEHGQSETTLEQVNAALARTPFAQHFAQEPVQLILQSIIGQHTADVQHIERRWHADRLDPTKGA